MSINNGNGPKAIPNSLIKRQLVDHAGKSFLLAGGKLSRTDDHQVVFAMEIAPFGNELKNPRVLWTGPICHVKITEADIFKGRSDLITFKWPIDPMEVLFAPNQFVSSWGNAIESIKKSYIKMDPPVSGDYIDDPKNNWCYRFVVVAKSYERFEIVMETVPTSMEVLKGCPWSESLMTGACAVDKWVADCGQTLPGELGPGILPFLQDNRLPQHQKECTLPSSNTIRQKVYETLSVMGSSADLDESEMEGYNPAKKRMPPVMPNIDQVEEASGTSRKRNAEGDLTNQPTTGTGNMDKIRDLLGGSFTPEEQAALGNNGENVTKKGTSSGGFDTPASVGMDVTGFMGKLPAGMSKDQVSHMTFADIKTAMKLSEQLGVEDRNEAVYRSATETKMIAAGEHNRKDKLHPAFFLPGSLAEPSVYWDKHPPRVEPHVTGIPLTHVGLENKVAPLAIQRAGDRSILLRISYFMPHNINVQQKAPKLKTHRGEGGAMGLSMDENWKEANKLSQFQDAVFAYMSVMADLFPRDYGPRNLLWVMHKLDWLSFRHDRIFALKLVLDGVLARYHYLNCQKKPPLSFKELEDFVESVLRGIGGKSKMPDSAPENFGNNNNNSYNSNNNNNNSDLNKSNDFGRGRGRGGRGRGAPAAAGSAARGATAAGPPLCYQYNKQVGCHREEKGRMCTLPSGMTVFHLCSQTNSKGEYCLGQHSYVNHK